MNTQNIWDIWDAYSEEYITHELGLRLDIWDAYLEEYITHELGFRLE